MKKKSKTNKKININQKSFYFEDYLETNQKQKKFYKSSISEDRIYVLFFFFICLITIFTIKITFISVQTPQVLQAKKNSHNFLPLRRDIVDRNGILISRNIKAYHAAIKPNLIDNKEKFLLNVKLNFPEISQTKLKKKLLNGKYFYLKKRLTEDERKKLWLLGDKSIKFEPYQSRIYPHAELYSHVLGQIDNDNYGISGVEKYFDKDLKNLKNIETPIKLTLDTNIQYFVKQELDLALETFQAQGAAALLMDSKNGEVLSLVSLPDYNINIRQEIKDKKYTNKITKNLYELGSVFKTFTVALALQEKLVEPNTKINNITKKIKCSKYQISDIHEFPKSMTVEDILIESSNIGSIKIAKKVGEDKFKEFIKNLNLLNVPELEIDEISYPPQLKWNKCKLETVSFGHGIMTTPLQIASAYGIISNGGYVIKPTLVKNNDYNFKKNKQIISEETSNKIIKILRKVVTSENGTASLADVFGYQIAGKTGTAQNYHSKDENINTFISIFPAQNPRYVFLVLLDNPKPAPHIVYNYRGNLITNIKRNESGWNSVYVTSKIIEKIGPILAINNDEVYSNHVVKKNN